MTLEQVKADIASGKCKMIYYSAHTLWWSHLSEDLEVAKAAGKIAQEKSMQEMINNPNTPKDKIEKLKGLARIIAGSSFTPLDPSGSPLYQMEDVKHWVEAAEKNPAHFGPKGLDAFMKAHQQNCEGVCSDKWEDYQ